jgi:predicted AAA+ superfamily ATPase
VKTPKVYVRDSGVLHALLGLRDGVEVMSHPRFGLSWEGFALEHVIASLQAERDAHFWGVHAGPELDLVVPRGGRLFGFEFKFADAPSATKSMLTAVEELDLARLFVVYPGERSFELADGIAAVPLGGLVTALREL